MTRMNPEVEQWFAELDHPLKEEMLRVRRILLEADERIEESIKWSAPTFGYKGNLLSYQPRAKQVVSLMFHRGSEIPGEHPLLEGEAALVRITRLPDEAAIESSREALAAAVRAWCDWKDSEPS